MKTIEFELEELVKKNKEMENKLNKANAINDELLSSLLQVSSELRALENSLRVERI